MSYQQTGFAAIRRRASWLALLCVLASPSVHAQVNIDQNKTPALIYENDCAACHKAIRGLASGRSRGALAAYLAQHYTSSDSQAAALAAYVLANGGGVGPPPSRRDLLGAQPRDAAGRSQNRVPAQGLGRRQGRTARRPAAPQKPAAPSAPSNPGPATATVTPAAAAGPSEPAAAPSTPPAAPATAKPAAAPSAAGDDIAD